MKNNETLKTAMDRRLSSLDSMPSCRPALMQRIAQEEAPVMKKKVSFALVFALVLVSLSVIALAAGILFSPKADASRLADKTIEDKYGITLEMLTFFYREETALEDGSVRVTYTGADNLEYVLGTYTVDVKNGKAEASWSHEKTAALEARKLSEEEMQAIGKEAIVSRYELSEAQADLLELYVQPLADEPNAWYYMMDGIPCFEVEYFLSQDPEKHIEKDGSYAVLVNVETGVIEKIVYESGLGGEG